MDPNPQCAEGELLDDLSDKFQIIIFSMVQFSNRKIYLPKLIGAPNNRGISPILDPVGHYGTPGSYPGFCWWIGIADGERVPPSAAMLVFWLKQRYTEL